MKTVLVGLEPRTLRVKLLLLICLVTLFGTVTIGAAGYLRLRQVIVESAIEALAGETRLVALKFTAAYEGLQADVRLLAHTPPVPGMIRASRFGGVDRDSGSTEQQWRQRLETIFTGLLELRPAYTQARYIGLADGGRELVRVNKTAKGIEVVSRDDYQRKAGEPYFSAAVALPPGRVYYSDVTYNREQGQIVLPKVPTIRVALAVYDEQGREFGLIVINADYASLLEETFDQVPSNREVTVINSAGDYMRRKPGAGLEPLEFHENYSRPPPVFQNYFGPGEQAEQEYHTDDDLYYFVRLGISPSETAHEIGTAIRVPLAALLAPAYVGLRETVVIGTVLVAISLLAAFAFGTLLTRRLAQMTETIRGADGASGRLELPEGENDEIGELSRAFNRLLSEREKLIDKLVRSNGELEEFAHVAAHDLKAPLRVIDNASKWIEEDLGDDLTEEITENMGLLRGRVQRMERLLDDLLDYARINRLDDERYHEKISGETLMRDVTALLNLPEAFRIEVSPAFDHLQLHRMPLQQIFLNLVSNAVKHHDKQQGTVSIGAEETASFFVFTVSDDGPGIAPAYHETVFKMFQTLRPRDQVEGSGMGLAVVKKHIELFGGTIRVHSEEGAGTTFRFTWPKRQERH
ncbi:signal transduction histidine kinase [Rhizobium halophytocola]|uniref:histidine kinase n=1 Tax=Rhizobium halophytocola TaxID=735519 RepID=A0ABS4DSW7_9HYPH|nr:ATP-binding protein [Rhizobium halophytocola]MBP1848789.1 signal transduction histidine kinase [Rhizobium halophytocola]